MTNVLLSCKCEVDYEIGLAHTKLGDWVSCRHHGPVQVHDMAGQVLECLDCDHIRYYDTMAKLTACVAATKHSNKKKHRVQHYHNGAKAATLCVHARQPVPVFTAGGPPF